MGDTHTSRNSGRKRSCDDDDPKRKKNREAARKCREKKVQETEDLKKKNEDLIMTNKVLTQKKQTLEKRLQECIEEIKKHEASGCQLPQNVVDIIRATESSQDFLPVGTVDLNSNKGHNANIKCRPSSMSIVNKPPVPAPTVTGLFSGNQVTAEMASQYRSRNPSSRSPSRSPPAPVQPSISNSLSNIYNGQPCWASLHQQSGQSSPRLSPAQTVPNIDTDQFVGNKHFSKFPDLNTAVHNAQNDPGIMDDSDDQSQSSQASSLLPMHQSTTSSYGFIPNSTLPSSPLTSNSSYVLEQNTTPFKKSPSNSITAGMKNLTEVVSQAMSTFEPTEVSDDLRTQLVQQLSEENDSNIVQNVQYAQMEQGANLLVEQEQSIPHSQPQQYSLRIHGRELVQLLRNIKQPRQPFIYQVFNNNPGAQLMNGGGPAISAVSDVPLPQIQTSVQEMNAVVEQVIYTSPNQVITHDIVDQSQRLTAVPMQQPEIENASVQLPTTVLSMIQESSTQPETSSGICIDSIDYSGNMRDLPSLSLTEDHPNIFEKKRRLNPE